LPKESPMSVANQLTTCAIEIFKLLTIAAHFLLPTSLYDWAPLAVYPISASFRSALRKQQVDSFIVSIATFALHFAASTTIAIALKLFRELFGHSN